MTPLKRFAFALGCFLCFTQVAWAAEEEISITPEAEYFLSLNSTTSESGDSKVSSLNQSQYGLFGLQVGKPFERYNTAVTLAFEVSDADLAVYQLYGSLARKGIMYKMGFYDPSDVSLGMEYLPFKSDDNYFGVYSAQDRYMGAEFEELGLNINFGARTAAHRADEDNPEATESVDRTVFATYYNNEFDWLQLSFAAVVVSNQIDENKDPSAEALAQGNYTEQVVTFGMGFNMDMMLLALQAEQISSKAEKAADAEVSTRANLSLDFPIGDRAGVSFSGTSKSDTDGSTNATLTNRSELGYAHLFGDLKLAWMLFSQSTKDDDSQQDDKESGWVLGMYVNY
ncbi:MAG: hypothetical protein RRB13_14690 [bacterium]|nr:hypothetical protein [bacterium]